MMQVVAIVGRPNSGKSTLFNKLIRRRKALVKDEPGVTRDRIYGKVEYGGKQFILIDTGGFLPDAEGITAEVQKQTRYAIEESDKIIFLMDGQSGLTTLDLELHDLIRSLKKPCFYVVNKLDNPSKTDLMMAEFFNLGVEKLYPVSAEHNLGLDELLNAITEDMEQVVEKDREEHIPRIAIVGRPNVGKSSLVNTLLGMERVVVSEIPGTTRDTVDVMYKRGDRTYIFLDTAGLRRRSRIYSRLEILSSIKALRAIDESDVSVLLIDSKEGLVSQDLRITQFIFENGKGFVLAINKWDLIQESGIKEAQKIKGEFLRKLERRFKFITRIPVVFISALKGFGINELLDTIELVIDERQKRVKTSELNRFLREVIKEKAPPDYKNHEVKINYCTQISTAPPVFLFFTNFPEGIPEIYRRYLKNKIYEKLGFIGTDIKLLFRRK